MIRHFIVCLIFGCVLCVSLLIGTVQADLPETQSGLDYYAQGGVVLDGIAYFTANDSFKGLVRPADFPSVVAFDVTTFKKLRTYNFDKTYDSSPFLFNKINGTPIIIAHEHENARTVAMDRDTGEVVWTSAANQPGAYFFGYSQYNRSDNSKLILSPFANGLHAMSSETGQDVWTVNHTTSGGVTPCVDQQNGWVFYQYNGNVLRIDANNGQVLKSKTVATPTASICGNTVLIDDTHGKFVATYWYGGTNNHWSSAIRVFDEDLNLVWEKTGLPIGKKATLTYADGKLVSGSGDHWGAATYEGDDWRYIEAYDIATGDVSWKCDLSDYEYRAIINVPYFNGHFYAETQDTPEFNAKLFRINGSNGTLEEVLEYGCQMSSCAPSIIAHGMMFSGNLYEDKIVVTKLADNSTLGWVGPFGDPQTNQMALPFDPNATLVPMQKLTPPIVVPEPSVAMWLLLFGGFGLILRRRVRLHPRKLYPTKHRANRRAQNDPRIAQKSA